MRLLILLAVVFFAVALVCTLQPTVVLTVGWAGWLTMGFLAWAIDVLIGGWVAPINLRGRRVE
jgi:hypothetical protein